MNFPALLAFVATATLFGPGYALLNSACAKPNTDVQTGSTRELPPDNDSRALGGNIEWDPPLRTIHMQALCEQRVARDRARQLELKERLGLKVEQAAVWEAFEKASQEADALDEARCAGLPEAWEYRPDFIEHVKLREYLTKMRLRYLQVVEPSLVALYAELTEEQKVTLSLVLSDLVPRR
jgi:hypothetical protein